MKNLQAPQTGMETLLKRQKEIDDEVEADLHHAVLAEYGTAYIHNNHFADDPFCVMTPRGWLVVQQFYADEQYGGMYE